MSKELDEAESALRRLPKQLHGVRHDPNQMIGVLAEALLGAQVAVIRHLRSPTPPAEKPEPSAAVGEEFVKETLARVDDLDFANAVVRRSRYGEGTFDDIVADIAHALKVARKAGKEAGLSAGRAELDRVHRAINNRAPHDKMADCVVEWIETAKERIAELEAGRAERGDGWKLASQPPKERRRYLCASGGVLFVALCDDGEWRSGTDEYPVLVTHWRELPPLPDAAKEELPDSGREG